jgi:hypothetical protein
LPAPSATVFPAPNPAFSLTRAAKQVRNKP